MSKIFISCGEYSGEMHASSLVKELFSKRQDLEFYAFASTELESLSVSLLADYKDYGFSGLTEVLRNLAKILSLEKYLITRLKEIKPDLIILIDYGAFNIRLAKSVKKYLPDTVIVDFIAPQIWASRPWRINSIKKYVDLVLATLPFEEELYKSKSIPVEYVGNPIFCRLPKQFPEINKSNCVLGIFPGSRKSEIKYHLPIILEAINKLKIPNLSIQLAKAPSISKECLQAYGLDQNSNIEILEHSNYQIMHSADFLWICSGTASLEAAFYAKPHLIFYRSNIINYLLYRFFRTINMAGLANIIEGRLMVKEFLQYDMNSENLVFETNLMIDSSGNPTQYYSKMSKDLDLFRRKFQTYETYKLVAERVLRLLGHD